jgi:hypothetical protein
MRMALIQGMENANKQESVSKGMLIEGFWRVRLTPRESGSTNQPKADSQLTEYCLSSRRRRNGEAVARFCRRRNRARIAGINVEARYHLNLVMRDGERLAVN